MSALTHVAATADGGLLDDARIGPPTPPAPLGGTLTGNGILVPVTGSTWQLKVRADADVT